jgi:hypothetical protein
MTVIAALAILGIATAAFSGWGKGYGRMGRGGCGGFKGAGCDYALSRANTADMSEETLEALDKERTAFLEATESIRQDLYTKDLALRTELNKDAPDAGIATRLQSEISELQNQLDAKRLDYQLKVREIAPDYSRSGRGYGGYGRMMGGGRGMNCPRW